MPRNPEMDELERWLAERKKIWQEARAPKRKTEVTRVLDIQIDVIDLIQHQIDHIRKAADLAAKEEAGKALKDL
jgi:hypothetical protein